MHIFAHEEGRGLNYLFVRIRTYAKFFFWLIRCRHTRIYPDFRRTFCFLNSLELIELSSINKVSLV